MNWFEALILGIVQGLTEFLPVSSSGHLTIGQALLHVEFAEGDMLLFDVMVHAATVCSTLLVLNKEVVRLFKGTFLTRAINEEKRYVLNILISMIPVLLVGLFLKDFVEDIFGSGLLIVGVCLLVTAGLLCFAQYAQPRPRTTISPAHAFIIGIAQAVAVLPGLSRSGATIATGIILGNKKEEVAPFSFLMVLIPILGAAFLDVIHVLKGEVVSNLSIGVMVIGFVSAFVTGCFACRWMIEIVKKQKLIYFAIYCAVIGTFAIIYGLY